MSLFIIRIALSVLALSCPAIALGPGAVNLRTAANYAILAETGISTVPASVITGNIGVSPAAATSLTGFSLTLSSDGTYSTSSQVSGKCYAASYNPPTPVTLATAISDMKTAYTNAGPTVLTPPNYTPTTGNLDGLTLTGGVYFYTGSASDVTIPSTTPGDVTFSGSATDTWVMQVSGTLIQSDNTQVKLIGSALAKNIFWVVAGAVTIGKNCTFEGIILGDKSIAVGKSTVNGRLLSQTAVTLDMTTVTP